MRPESPPLLLVGERREVSQEAGLFPSFAPPFLVPFRPSFEDGGELFGRKGIDLGEAHPHLPDGQGDEPAYGRPAIDSPTSFPVLSDKRSATCSRSM